MEIEAEVEETEEEEGLLLPPSILSIDWLPFDLSEPVSEGDLVRATVELLFVDPPWLKEGESPKTSEASLFWLRPPLLRLAFWAASDETEEVDSRLIFDLNEENSGIL